MLYPCTIKQATDEEEKENQRRKLNDQALVAKSVGSIL